MANPVVAATNTSSETTGTTSHTVSLPSSISAGNLLMVFFGMQESNGIEIPSGWSQLNRGYETTSESIAGFILYRIADGTEGSTLTVTSNASFKSSHASYRITGHAGIPVSTSYVTGSSSNPNPPSLTPYGGSQDYLFIATAFTRSTTATAYPSGYTGSNLTIGTSFAGSGVMVATKNVTGTSDDPGTFTTAISSLWTALTIAIPSVDVTTAPVIDGYEEVSKGTGDITITKPEDVVENDLMIAVIVSDNAITAAPSGWTQEVYNSDQTSTELYVYRKVAGASEGSNYTWSIPSSIRAGCIYRITGFSTDTIVENSSEGFSNTNTTSITSSGFTPSENSLLMFISGVIGRDKVARNHSIATSNPEWNIRTTIQNASTPDLNLTIATARRSEGTATGTFTATQASETFASIALNIKAEDILSDNALAMCNF